MRMATTQLSSDFKYCLPLFLEVGFHLSHSSEQMFQFLVREVQSIHPWHYPKSKLKMFSNSPTDCARQNKSKMINSAKVCSAKEIDYLIQYIESSNLPSTCRYRGLGSYKQEKKKKILTLIFMVLQNFELLKRNHSDIIK